MTTRRTPRVSTGESGYAMLLVFLMAAMIAIALYREVPRFAFEQQRAKEQLLIERGEQYKRAIQLFVRKMSRYPATIEELENTNNIRFLRKRYVDPMTGKDKWRLVHINGGVLTDSIVPKQGQGQQQPQGNTNTFIGEGPVMGATTDPNQQQNNPALRRRASDDRPVVTQEVAQPAQPDADENTDTDNNNDNNSDDAPAPGTAVNTNIPGAVPNQPGMSPGRMIQPGMPAYPNQPGHCESGHQQWHGEYGHAQSALSAWDAQCEYGQWDAGPDAEWRHGGEFEHGSERRQQRLCRAVAGPGGGALCAYRPAAVNARASWISGPTRISGSAGRRVSGTSNRRIPAAARGIRTAGRRIWPAVERVWTAAGRIRAAAAGGRLRHRSKRPYNPGYGRRRGYEHAGP